MYLGDPVSHLGRGSHLTSGHIWSNDHRYYACFFLAPRRLVIRRAVLQSASVLTAVVMNVAGRSEGAGRAVRAVVATWKGA